MEKLVVAINGAGGAGKDSFCEAVAGRYRVRNISSIDPIKKLAEQGGWTYDDKSLSGRRLLAELKAAFTRYNDLPTRYVVDQYRQFLEDPAEEVLFVHIREPEEIEKFRRAVPDCRTLLVRSPRTGDKVYGNDADDCVENFDYDFVYRNDKTLEEMPADAVAFFAGIMTRKPQCPSNC